MPILCDVFGLCRKARKIYNANWLAHAQKRLGAEFVPGTDRVVTHMSPYFRQRSFVSELVRQQA